MTNKIILCLTFALLLLAVACGGDSRLEATVERVVDGDTIVLTDGSRVRYKDIDTPETVAPNTPIQCYGPESTAHNRFLVSGRMVTLEIDDPDNRFDQFGRILAYVYVGDTFVNAELVRGGFARYNDYGDPWHLATELKQLEQEAQIKQAGRWGEC